jgi:stage II sporulation protein D
MRDKAAKWAAIFITTLFLPYFFTMVVSGAYEKETEEASGIVLIDEEGNKIEMEDFLPYMIAGEIDWESEEETLKAQAVIARTNLLRALDGKEEEELKNISLVYVSEDELEKSYGEKKREEVLSRLQKAVKETKGVVMTYQGEYIDALYHPVSIGTTVSAEEIYGKDIPYLIGVDSSQDVEAENYTTIKEVGLEEAVRLLKEKIKGENLTADQLMDQLNLEEKTESGFVKTVKIGEETLTGEEWKEMFSLPSTNFYLEEADGKLRMITLGQGHCIGLSQYGANEMAKQEKSWEEILSWYYTGIEFSKI